MLLLRPILTLSVLVGPTPARSYDVTSAAARQQNLLEYIESRSDLSAGERGAWDKAVRGAFGGKALKGGTDEGVTVAKSVISAAIFFGVEPRRGARGAYAAYHDTYRWVPPPVAINYQLMVFEGRKPKQTARQIAYNFPRYFNEEMAPDLARWWHIMLKRGAISRHERPTVERLLAETRQLMRPMFKERLWHGAELEARRKFATTAEQPRVDAALDQLRREMMRDFIGVGGSRTAHDASRSFYDRYRAAALDMGVSPRDRPVARRAPAKPASPPRVTAPPPPPTRPESGIAQYDPSRAHPDRHRRIPAPLPGEPLIAPYDGWKPTLGKTVDGWIGTPYLWGGITRAGVDCSAFVRAVYRETFDVELPRNSRVQHTTGRGVEQGELGRGDLIFFDTLDRGRVTHVGVYLGGGRFAHASSSRGVTQAKLKKKYYQRAYWGSRRLIRQ